MTVEDIEDRVRFNGHHYEKHTSLLPSSRKQLHGKRKIIHPLTKTGLLVVIVTEDQLKGAVFDCFPFKSLGLDGGYPALFQWGLDALVIPLVGILRDYLTLKHIPKAWSPVERYISDVILRYLNYCILNNKHALQPSTW